MDTLQLTAEKRNAVRQELFRVLPLHMPFSMNMSISNICNFRCNYCIQSQYGDGHYFDRKNMELPVFKACIDHIAALGKLKSLVLAGYGEPLLNPEIISMVRYAKEKDVTDMIEIITNGSSLKTDLIDQLVETGLGRIRISLQGLTSKEYYEICGYNLDYQEFIENLSYLYNHKNNIQIYIKIMDIMVNNEEKRKEFYERFSQICDQIAIEALIPVIQELDYSSNASDFQKNFYGERLKEYHVCTAPFYSCNVDYDGSVVPCCVVPYPSKFGNLSESLLSDIWGNEKHIAFLLQLLEHQTGNMKTCRGCTRYKYMMLPNDVLDGHEDILLEKYRGLQL